MNLFWVETDDHHEDWFVVAKDPIEAETFFVDYEGYDEDDASAMFVCGLDIPDCEIDWADNDLLISLGGTVEDCNGARVVHLQGQTYAEGMLESIIQTGLQAQKDLESAMALAKPKH